MKTEKELNELKEEMKRMQQKLAELTEEELKQVTGGKDQEEYIPEGIITKVEISANVDDLNTSEPTK